jgi:hypothetical protein
MLFLRCLTSLPVRLIPKPLLLGLPGFGFLGAGLPDQNPRIIS